jgi:F0F1-type ATP synthase assembly protein I
MSENKKNKKKNNKPGLANYAKYSGMAFEMIAIILISVWGGNKLDAIFNDGKALYVIILSIVGVGAALYFALKDFIRPK